MVSKQGYIALCYSLSVVSAVAVAIYAFYKGYVLRKKIGDTEAFITARGQVAWLRIAWSFYAGAVGAWVITSPAGYASYAGLLGLIMYALASGTPFVMIAYAGEKIRGKLPHVLSLTDYMGWRFGDISKLYVVLVILFNMSIALLAEFYTIGLIFKFFVHSVPYAMVIVVGVLTLAYTAYGGLLVSIFTDTVQGVASLLFFFILAIYMAATFRPGELPTPMPCDPSSGVCVSGTPDCGQNWTDSALGSCPTTGYSSIFTMPASLFAATVFSEAMWQRAWASKDRKTLQKGAWFGCLGVVLVVFFAGFTGLLTIWAQNPVLTQLEDSQGNPKNISVTFNGQTVESQVMANYDLYMFQVLYRGQFPDVQGGKYGFVIESSDSPTGFMTYPTIQNGMGVILVMLAVIMNEGAVDSIQNGMAAAIASYCAPIVKGWNLLYTRGVVIVINAILIGIGAWLALDNVKVKVIQLFLITNLLSCCSAIPVLFGLSNRLQKYIGGGSFLFSCLFSIFCLSWYGVDYYYSNYPDGYFDYYAGKQYNAGSFNSAMYYTWIGNNYAWQFFLVPMGVSLGCMLLSTVFFYVCIEVAFVRNFLERIGVYHWINKPLLGLRAAATHPDYYPSNQSGVANDQIDKYGDSFDGKVAGEESPEEGRSSDEIVTKVLTPTEV